jgi:hypothetical protein
MLAEILFVVARVGAMPSQPTFYRDVLPILQTHCQECHRSGEMAPMAFTSYKEVRPWAAAIREAVASRKMPPWLADPCCGKFANDRSLATAERDTLIAWANGGALEGDPHDLPNPNAASPPRPWAQGWNLPAPDLVLSMPAYTLPARGPVEYQYFAVHTGFAEDRWISASEVAPGNRTVVHHVVAFIREPGSTWTHGPTQSDILGIYTPGSSADVLPPGTAKLIPAGSDIVFEIHYTPSGKRVTAQTRVALTFAKSPPEKRVLTLQLTKDDFRIPPGERDYHVTAWGTLPNDALLLGFLPHMHLRGRSFEYLRLREDGQPELLLKVPAYDFYWQLSYRLAAPLPLKKGTRLLAVAVFDNSKTNPRNPDPTKEVRWGQQSWEEMIVGFFDVAVDPHLGKPAFFVR